MDGCRVIMGGLSVMLEFSSDSGSVKIPLSSLLEIVRDLKHHDNLFKDFLNYIIKLCGPAFSGSLSDYDALLTACNAVWYEDDKEPENTCKDAKDVDDIDKKVADLEIKLNSISL